MRLNNRSIKWKRSVLDDERLILTLNRLINLTELTNLTILVTLISPFKIRDVILIVINEIIDEKRIINYVPEFAFVSGAEADSHGRIRKRMRFHRLQPRRTTNDSLLANPRFTKSRNVLKFMRISMKILEFHNDFDGFVYVFSKML